MTEIKLVTFKEVSEDPNFQGLLAEYAIESAIEGLPRPNCQIDMYKSMEEMGIIHILGSFKDGVMTGFISLVVTVIPHYGATVATTESYFVGEAYRKDGAGLMLLREAERYAAILGAVGLLVSAPFGGKLAEVMSKTGYTESNLVFFRSLE